MLTTELVVTLPGRPAPKGSLKCIGRGGRHRLIEQLDATIRPWRENVHRATKQLADIADHHQPLGVEVTLTVPRPKTVRHLYPVTRSSGDVDKLARLILDALQDSHALPDDAAVIELIARKSYPDGPLSDALPYPGARIRVYPIGDTV